MCQETKQLTLEEIDLLFGERVLPDDLDDKQKVIELEKITAAKEQLAGQKETGVHWGMG